VPETLSPHATWAYSWRRPPSLSRRMTLTSASTGSGSARSGLAWFSARCGRCPLKWDSYSDRTLRRLQLGPDRRGTGSMPALCRIRQTVAGPTFRPRRPAWAARPPPVPRRRPAAGPAGARARRPPPPPGPLRPCLRPRGQLLRLHRAGPDPHPAQWAFIRANRHRGVRALMRACPDHHCRHRRTPHRHRRTQGSRGGHALLQCWRSRPFRATPRRDPAGWHLVLKPGHSPAGRWFGSPAHRA
jgi:hypothetical protein